MAERFASVIDLLVTLCKYDVPLFTRAVRRAVDARAHRGEKGLFLLIFFFLQCLQH